MSKLMPVNRTPENTSAPDFVFFCPACKCGHGVWTTHKNGFTGAIWGFNGNMDAPTFTPSIKIQRDGWEPPVTPENMDEYRNHPWPQQKVTHICHLFVENGYLKFCTDCTHDFRGKTVPMPDL